MSDTDIVQWLRQQSVGDYSVFLWEAADEIERLRADLAQRTAERDEARRISCASSAELRYIDQPDDMTLDFHARRIAAERGWDCFKGEP